ncbi:Lrp/AsnC family transcriptional regulator [Roseibium sp. RKSG952]|uniref:Lrp/AsnC family transcriptional regulator n=1 Tax=Roseibium sp. RKSG952 TaxID=2529384 RepID=UPI0012BB81AD|nr:Lrp/AsnC family transcriptional regulator [Roseibium sp. RKSG952]MTH96156.1 Lrp/AsnC family transcriptional regulator [Roseibium sp. RKSG952]
MEQKFDHIDRALLRALQRDARLSQRELAETVGLSQNACWRRLKALNECGLIQAHTIRIDPADVGLNLTVFVMVRTRHHSKDWLETFRREVLAIPNVIDFYRVAGDYDYMLKIMAEDMNAFDRIYQRLIERIDLETVTSYMTMEAIADSRDIPI